MQEFDTRPKLNTSSTLAKWGVDATTFSGFATLGEYFQNNIPPQKYVQLAENAQQLLHHIGINSFDTNFFRWHMSDVFDAALVATTASLFINSAICKSKNIEIREHQISPELAILAAGTATLVAISAELPQISSQGTDDIPMYLAGISLFLFSEVLHRRLTKTSKVEK